MAAAASGAGGAGGAAAAGNASPALGPRLAGHYGDCVAAWPGAGQLPIVYSEAYNISLFGVEKLHPFDAAKFRRVVDGLAARGVISDRGRGGGDLVEPLEAPEAALLDVHTPGYLGRLKSSSRKVAEVMELAPLAVLPAGTLDKKVLAPMRTHVAGTMLAAALAVERGWAVNVGGGLHHGHAEDGSGWCPYDDIYLAVRRLRRASGGAVARVLLVDLDAHQGNGVQRDKLRFSDRDLFVVDAFNGAVFPLDGAAKAGIDVKVELPPGTRDGDYLSRLDAALDEAARAFPSPQLVVFNAGTDILEGDPLGKLAVSPAGVVERDLRVWGFAVERVRAPILVLLSGGYTRASAGVIVDALGACLARFAGLGAGGGGGGGGGSGSGSRSGGGGGGGSGSGGGGGGGAG
ncbi:hypothetical protein Rsub_07445 [Raphidocelis subcapitata]|uniref:Histone deacetylase domain-containing protein n=1 Tax=Raphidocelis subcapitata TaxID=307507 RepID=A0A2V0P4Z9_9CHLO|nr:hypothetical protein Rsub_07445 [Raphidocelis subcapitata]|eukprot:GBF94944.1 hypothetical protein Rsub_07445 [Raphidocelis subcapitata]